MNQALSEGILLCHEEKSFCKRRRKPGQLIEKQTEEKDWILMKFVGVLVSRQTRIALP
jgi:hypothetical protein